MQNKKQRRSLRGRLDHTNPEVFSWVFYLIKVTSTLRGVRGELKDGHFDVYAFKVGEIEPLYCVFENP